MEKSAELELTPFLEGSLIVYQPKKGFRFGIDSILLANFLKLKPEKLNLEIGAGSGIISLIGLKKFPEAKIFALEIEPIFIKCLKKNAFENKVQDRLFIIRGDMNSILFKPGIFDVIFSNPPYFKKESGRLSPYEIENIARKNLKFDLDSFLHKVSFYLKNKGNFYLIFTALRLAELIYLLKKHNLEPKILRLVYSYPHSEAKLVLILAKKNAKEEIRIFPPLYIYSSYKGEYSEEVKKMLKRLE